MISKHPRAESDITLVLEGSYPYVRGGVSSWVHQIITGLPNLTFSIVFLGTSSSHYSKMLYKLPSNVVNFNIIYLFDENAFKSSKKHHIKSRKKESLRMIFDYINSNTSFNIDYIKKYYNTTTTRKNLFISNKDFYNSYEAWQLIIAMYEKNSNETSFIDYIWNLRAIYGPIIHVINGVLNLPKSKMVHTISTGYAGFCASLMCQFWSVPLTLTEHGIYNKERKLDIFKSPILSNIKSNLFTDMIQNEVGEITDMWLQLFDKLSKYTYDNSNQIITLYEGNQKLQIKAGASKSKTMLIPNGISQNKFSKLIIKRTSIPPKVIGLIGRVVSIKDIHTFILSILEIKNHIPDIQGWVIGPEEEEPLYVEECKTLVSSLSLDSNIHFKGFQRVEDIYPKLGLCALTSLSEAQPLVVLEAFSAGVPCVTTDVGCCKELIYGNSEEDMRIGVAGAVVPISSPLDFAKSAIELLTDINKWKNAQEAGIQRVATYYTESNMLDSYKDIYKNSIK